MSRTPLIVALAAAGLSLPGIANACGGFFCNNQAPVDQTAEEILFAVDSEKDETTMHIKIMYEGPSEEFAWVVPVGGIPEVGVGTDAVFAALQGFGAQWNLVVDSAGECEGYYWGYGGYDYDVAFSSSAGATASPGVTVIDQQAVGPYDTVTLQAQSSTDLVNWLNANGYDVPAALDPVLSPYVSPDSSFVALKLQKDRDAGDLVPLTLKIPGQTPMIPIQLTSVAATPDMRLRVYLMGDHRAVPESYLHVQLNHMAIDWWTRGSNYEDVVSKAADEAGGHAFATDYAGSPQMMAGVLYRSEWTEARLAATTSAFEFLTALQDWGYPADPALRQVLNDHIPPPPGLTDTELYNCPWCYQSELEAMPFDPVAAAADVNELVLVPRQEADAMFTTYPWISRLTSSVSPAEMTVDPVFVFNPDMGEVDSVRTATDTTFCGIDGDWWDSRRLFRVADGRGVTLPSRENLAAWGITEIEYIDSLTEPAAAIIEETSASGQPVVLVDNTQWLEENVNSFQREHDAEDPEGRGCGCSSSGGAGYAPLGLLGLGLLGLRRRR